jgi:RimJ/RimL family protein N-acetyltransferase
MGTPMLRGERTWLRMLEKADVLATDVDDRDLGHYAGFKFAFAGEMVDGWLNELRGEMMAGTAFQFSICLIGSRDTIGGAGLRNIDQANGSAVVSIFLTDATRWGTGLGTDAMNALLDFGFGELRLERVALEVFDYNERAIASYRKAGFAEEVRRRRARFHRGEFHDVVTMAILRPDWLALARPRSWDLPALEGG